MNEESEKPAANFFRWLKPSYDETSLFLMSLTCIALFATDSGLQREVIVTLTQKGILPAGYFLIWAGFVAGGLGLSLFHAFASRPKSDMEKTWMAGFAMALNGIAGILCGIQLMDQPRAWFAVLAAWNIASGVALLYRMGLAPEDSMSDENARWWEIVTGTVILAGVFAYCRYCERLNWQITYSICVAYSTNIDHVLRNIVKVLRHA